MTIKFTYHDFESSTALQNYTVEKFEHLYKLNNKLANVHVIFKVNKVQRIAEANLSLPGAKINASAESEDMYKAVDALVDKLSRQLIKHKEKATEHN